MNMEFSRAMDTAHRKSLLFGAWPHTRAHETGHLTTEAHFYSAACKGYDINHTEKFCSVGAWSHSSRCIFIHHSLPSLLPFLPAGFTGASSLTSAFAWRSTVAASFVHPVGFALCLWAAGGQKTLSRWGRPPIAHCKQHHMGKRTAKIAGLLEFVVHPYNYVCKIANII